MTMCRAGSAGAPRSRSGRVCRFLRDTRGGATAFMAAGVTVMTVAAAALITDHIWLVDQRDVLKTAADAASVATTLAFEDQIADNPDITDKALKAVLKPIAQRYIEINLAHLAPARLAQAKRSLDGTITLDINRDERTVKVGVKADLGGTLFSRHILLLDNYEGPETIKVKAGVETVTTPVQVVLAIDTSTSMSYNLNGDAVQYGDPLAPGETCTESTNSLDCSRMAVVKEAARQLVAILNPSPITGISIGVVPWHKLVRLGDGARDNWEREGWAGYPTRRSYAVPYLNCGWGRAATCWNLPSASVEDLPAPAPEAWMGCLDEDRLDLTGTAELPPVDRLLEPPSGESRFAQAYFVTGFGYAYNCLNPESSNFPSNVDWQYCYNPPSGVSRETLSSSSVFLVKPESTGSQLRYCTPDTSPILPLSAKSEEIEQAIAVLQPVGKRTYSALGVLWGQRLLMPSWKDVWGSGAAPDSSNPEPPRRVIVLLTDGEDTRCGLGNHGCDDSAAGISRKDACEAAKAQGTEIFVIAAVEPGKIRTDPNDPSAPLTPFAEALENCSSKKDNPDGTYVFLNNATPEKLEAAFEDIAKQLRTLRKIM